jgi:hypothetical protein
MAWTPLATDSAPYRQWVWFASPTSGSGRPYWVASATLSRWENHGWTHWQECSPPDEALPTVEPPDLPNGCIWGEHGGYPAILDEDEKLLYSTDGTVVIAKKGSTVPFWAFEAFDSIGVG